MRNIIPLIFYGNIFYGVCALLLCLASNLQHGLPPNGPHFYFLTFSITVLYYSNIYVRSNNVYTTNVRMLWYRQHHVIIKQVMMGILMLVIADALYVMIKFRKVAGNSPPAYWFVLLLIPLVGFFYTYKKIPVKQVRQLRSIGWLKPFFIGFAWAGIVTVYPLFFRQLQSGIPTEDFILPNTLYCLQIFLYISTLAIIFDIKDYEEDQRLRLNTYPALLGTKKTLWLIITPLLLLSLGALFLYHKQQHRSTVQFLIETVPYLLLTLILPLVTRHRSILFYLVIVDGLMLVKAICGIISIQHL